MEIKDKFNLLISFSALVVAGLSFWYTYQSNISEEIVITVSNYDKDYDLTMHIGIPGVLDSVDKLYKATIINNSNNTVNFLEARYLHIIDGSQLSKVASKWILDGMNNRLAFPLTIKPGETKDVLFQVEIKLTDEILNKLGDKYLARTSRITFKEAQRHLWDNGIDFYGNKIVKSEFGKGYVRYRRDEWEVDNLESQTYIYTLITSRGNSISITFSEFGQSGKTNLTNWAGHEAMRSVVMPSKE
jgi:hypothetical protein